MLTYTGYVYTLITALLLTAIFSNIALLKICNRLGNIMAIKW